SRRRHTRSYGDWSSDVCSSDLFTEILSWSARTRHQEPAEGSAILERSTCAPAPNSGNSVLCRSQLRLVTTLGRVTAGKDAWESRSEERRVGKECRSRMAPEDGR